MRLRWVACQFLHKNTSIGYEPGTHIVFNLLLMECVGRIAGQLIRCGLLRGGHNEALTALNAVGIASWTITPVEHIVRVSPTMSRLDLFVVLLRALASGSRTQIAGVMSVYVNKYNGIADLYITESTLGHTLYSSGMSVLGLQAVS